MKLWYLVGVDDKLFLLRMQVADDDDVTDVADADIEVSGEQWTHVHVHQSSDARQSVTHFRSWVAASQ